MAIPKKPPWKDESANQGSDRAMDKLTREHNRFAHFHDAAILGMYRNKTADGLKGDLKRAPAEDNVRLLRASQVEDADY